MTKASIPMLRRQMELANILCKGQVAFVVIPVVDDADHQPLDATPAIPGGTVVARASRMTELGEEVQCSKCQDFWPADSEFYYFNGGKPHSWCKDCYINDDKIKAKVQRYLDKTRKPASAAA